MKPVVADRAVEVDEPAGPQLGLEFRAGPSQQGRLDWSGKLLPNSAISTRTFAMSPP